MPLNGTARYGWCRHEKETARHIGDGVRWLRVYGYNHGARTQANEWWQVVGRNNVVR